MKPSDYVTLRFPSSPILSHNGDALVFPIKSVDEQKNNYRSAIYMKTDNNDYEQFTSGTHTDNSPKWSNDDQFIAFLSSRSGKSQLYVIKRSGGEAQQVTNFSTGVTSFQWSHNNKTFLVTSMVNEHELRDLINPDKKNKVGKSFVLEPELFKQENAKKEIIRELSTDPRVINEGYYRRDNYYLEGRFQQPFLVDFTPQGKFSVEEDHSTNIRHIGEFSWHYDIGEFSLNDSFILISRIKDPTVSVKTEYLKIDLTENFSHTELFSTYGFSGTVRLSPDGNSFLYEGGRQKKGENNPDIYDDAQIFVANLQSPSSPNCLTENYDRSAESPRWVGNETIAFLSPRDGRVSLHTISTKMQEVKSIINEDQDINSFSISKEGNKIAYEVSHKTFPTDIFTCSLDGSNVSRVTNVNNKYLTDHTPGKIETVSFDRDGVQFHGWLMTPHDHEGNTSLPVVLAMHGGPAVQWTPHTKSMFLEFNSLVSKGYAIFFCNPRGSDGYGREFRGAVHKNWGDLPSRDIIAGLNVALDKFSFLDKNRIVVTGGSYAGYMTAWLVLHPEFSNLFKAGVSQRGVYEFSAFSQTTDIPIWFELQFDHELLDKDRYELYHRDSPLFNIKNLKCPLLIIHSENDFRVPIVNAEQLFWAGKRYGKTVQFVRYPRDGHELSRSGEPRHVIDRLNRIVDWFEKYNTK